MFKCGLDLPVAGHLGGMSTSGIEEGWGLL